MSPVSGQPPAADRLDSWKEIAAYFGREVRTVQGWEKSEGLPVHRHQHARQGSVYAFRSELEAWRQARKGTPEPAAAAPPIEDATPPASRRRTALVSIGVGIAVLLSAGLLWKSRLAPAAGEPLTSVVVLPFVDFSPQKDQEYFSDGLTEEIIDALARVPNLRVVARTSAFAFKGKPRDIREIGRQLNVSAVLEGSVRKSGDDLRITAQLNRVSDGTHLWSRTYDRRLRDVFAVQSEISRAIAAQLRAGDVPQRQPTEDLEAYRLYQEGRYFFNQFQPPESNYKAIERYQQAIGRDPKFALAYAGLADAYAYLAENFVVKPTEVMPKAKEAAEKAVAFDDNSAEAHTSLGMVKLDYDRDREGAQHEFERAMQLNPGAGWSRHWYAHSLESQGRIADALTEMRAALALDPLSIPINWDVGAELLGTHQYDEAVRHLTKAGELFPNVPLLGYMLAQAQRAKGNMAAYSRIVDGLKSQTELAKDPMFMAFFATRDVYEGRQAEARKTLARLEELRKTQYVDGMMVLDLCSTLGDRQEFSRWLQRADEERSSMFVYMPLLKDFYRFK